MTRGYFTNSGKLALFIIKRERVVSAVWLVLLAAFSISVAPAISAMFPGAEARNNFAASFNNPIMVAMMGPVYGIGDYTPGAMYGGMMYLWYIITVGAMNIFFAARNTRADEELGRAEVVRSLPAGRLSIIHSAMLAGFALNAAVAVLTGLGLAVLNIEGMDMAGCMLYGAGAGATGLFFAALSLFFCQLTAHAGGATGASFAALGVIYLLRAAGDVRGNEILACLSPLGLAQRSQIFVANHVWPIFV